MAYLSCSARLDPWRGMVFGGLCGAVFLVLLNRFLYTPFIRRGARLFTMIIVTIAVSLILQDRLQAIWGSNFSACGKAMRATASDPATWRGRFPVHWADWLDPRIVYDAQSSPWAMKLP